MQFHIVQNKYKKIILSYCNMISKLPYDIQWNIVKYIEDIDIRRKFNIYGKINIEKFKILNTIIRTNIQNHGNYKRHNFVENCINTIYRYHNRDGFSTICHDLVDIEIEITETKVNFKIYVYKLKSKPFDGYTNNNDIYYKGPLENDYYWQNINIEYSVY